MKPSPQQLERIKIFLTDQHRSRSKIAHMSKQVMLTVEAFYKKPELADGYREDYGLTDIHNMGLDSGGFQFLMGKLNMSDTKTLPCGIEVPTNAQNTIDLYKRTGITKNDLPIQLDLPPRYDLPPDHRKQLIEQGAMYFYEMLPDMPGTVPVVHGWTRDELEYSLELALDPDRLSSGSFLGAKNHWTMGHMNPHKAVGTFKALNTVYYKDYTQKRVGVGTNKGLMTVDYNDYFVSRGAVATPVPGALDVRDDVPFVNKVVATPLSYNGRRRDKGAF